MKKVVLLFVLAISTSLIFAQTTEQDSAMSRKEKRIAETAKLYQQTKELINNKDFVLESDYLRNRYGDRYMVSSVINFVKVQPDNVAVIQIGNNHSLGANGVGGITAKGKIIHWKVIPNEKNKSFFVRMTVSTPIGLYDVNFSISPAGSTTAQLTTAYGGRITFEGDVVPNDQSMVYEGTSI